MTKEKRRFLHYFCLWARQRYCKQIADRMIAAQREKLKASQ